MRAARCTWSWRGAVRDGSFGNAGDGALYRSTDGAEHWEKLPLPEELNGPNGLAIDPKDPNRLYLAAWGREVGKEAREGGIFLSTDGGKKWRHVLSQDQHVYDVTIDPRDRQTALRRGIRIFGMAIVRSRRNLEAHCRIRFQMGTPRDCGSE